MAIRTHGLVPGAFGHRVEGVGEEAFGFVCQPSVRTRPLHQDRDELDVLQARRLDMLADGTVADQPQFHGHESRASTQRAQAMSWSSLRSGAMSCTDSGRPNGPALNGSAMQGVPKSVQKRLKIGSPV